MAKKSEFKATKIELSDGKSKIVLPITPESYDITSGVNNETVNINGLGEILLKGKPTLMNVSWSSFFPYKHYHFCQVPEDKMKSALGYVLQFRKWMKDNKTITLTIWNVMSLDCVVSAFDYGQNDGTGDINYTVTLTEVKTVKTANAATQTAGRPVKDVVAHLYKWKKGDTWKKVAKKETGKSENWSRLRKLKHNVKVRDEAANDYAKKHPKKRNVKESVVLIGYKILIK